MPRRLRIGTQVWPDDPFWVQVQQAIRQRAEELDLDLVMVEAASLGVLPDVDQENAVEELLALDLNAAIGWNLDQTQLLRVLDAGLPVVDLGESEVRHPLFVSPHGLNEIAARLGEYLAQQLGGSGSVLMAGGLQGHGEDGRSRIAGLRAALQPYPAITVQHLPSPWPYAQAHASIVEAMRSIDAPLDAIFGLSDSQALAARDAGRAQGLVDERTLVVGVNGDPLALAAITAGTMTATMLTPASELGTQAIDLAVRAAQGQPLPRHYSYRPRLVTAANVAEVAAQQLLALAALPSRLVGQSQQQEQHRLRQLETSLEINRLAGLIYDRDRLAIAIADLIRADYEYDEVQLFRWDAARGALDLHQPDLPSELQRSIDLAVTPILQQVLTQNAPVFIPDMQHSHRFAPERSYSETRSRVVVPIRLGGQITGLLDLHSYRSTHHSRYELVALQALADQLGIAMRNSELYGEALKARALAEKADQLKSRLLANVSHELRTPLNIILGYTQSAIETLSPHSSGLPATLQRDLEHVYSGGKHLHRLINDLLDLSRAEIDELDLLPETIATRAFLEEVYQSFASQADPTAAVSLRLDVPARLPVLHADPVRLRQILLNLLQNALRFTRQGEVVLGAEIAVPHVHIWVADTGSGIPIELQEQIFEPFVTAPNNARHDSIGLGLSITRRLVALHHGSMTLESQPGQGSTFHVYMPLPNLSGRPITIKPTNCPALLLIAADERPDETIVELCRRQGLALHRLSAGVDLLASLADVQPVALVWNLAEAGADSWGLFQQVRGQPTLCELPVILYHHDSDDGAGADIALTGVVLKPLSDARLLEAIDQLRQQEAAGPILLVDDDGEAHELYRRLIEAHLPGYPIRSAHGGREALEAVRLETPSLVLLDLVMPDIDGFAVLEQLRAMPQTRNVPVLMISGYMLSLEDIQRLDQARVAFHSKGMLTDLELADVVRRALSQPEALLHSSPLVKHAVAYIQHNYAGALSRQEIADAVGVNADYLTRIFHRELGISPWDYLNRYRIRGAKTLLRTTRASISTIAMQVGFSDAAYFSRVFNRETGTSPREYREQSS